MTAKKYLLMEKMPKPRAMIDNNGRLSYGGSPELPILNFDWFQKEPHFYTRKKIKFPVIIGAVG